MAGLVTLRQQPLLAVVAASFLLAPIMRLCQAAIVPANLYDCSLTNKEVTGVRRDLTGQINTNTIYDDCSYYCWTPNVDTGDPVDCAGFLYSQQLGICILIMDRPENVVLRDAANGLTWCRALLPRPPPSPPPPPPRPPPPSPVLSLVPAGSYDCSLSNRDASGNRRDLTGQINTNTIYDDCSYYCWTPNVDLRDAAMCAGFLYSQASGQCILIMDRPENVVLTPTANGLTWCRATAVTAAVPAPLPVAVPSPSPPPPSRAPTLVPDGLFDCSLKNRDVTKGIRKDLTGQINTNNIYDDCEYYCWTRNVDLRDPAQCAGFLYSQDTGVCVLIEDSPDNVVLTPTANGLTWCRAKQTIAYSPPPIAKLVPDGLFDCSLKNRDVTKGIRKDLTGQINTNNIYDDCEYYCWTRNVDLRDPAQCAGFLYSQDTGVCVLIEDSPDNVVLMPTANGLTWCRAKVTLLPSPPPMAALMPAPIPSTSDSSGLDGDVTLTRTKGPKAKGPARTPSPAKRPSSKPSGRTPSTVSPSGSYQCLAKADVDMKAAQLKGFLKATLTPATLEDWTSTCEALCKGVCKAWSLMPDGKCYVFSVDVKIKPKGTALRTCFLS